MKSDIILLKKFLKNFFLTRKIIRRLLQIKRKRDKKRRINGHYQYTVVSAVYNVEKYLDDFFESITTQTLIFQNHIHLIMVDDGSPDKSAQIIKKWQKKYPENITYLWKENGGISSARNFGLNHVKADWVTFIDPDDMVDYNYFEVVDSFLFNNRQYNFLMIACNFLYYHERNGLIKNTHPLRYKFKATKTIYPVSDLRYFVHLAANSTFFNVHKVKESRLLFDEKVKPNFEDGHFVHKLFIQESMNGEQFIAFLQKAKYFYRKRADKSSTLDTTWTKKEQYDDVLKYGCLDLLKTAHNTLGYVPLHTARTVLYHLSWYFKYLLNHDEKILFLHKKEKEKFKQLLKEIFTFIDNETIREFGLAGIWFYHKIGWLYHYKNHVEIPYIAYADQYDSKRQEVRIKYFYPEEVEEKWLVNGQQVQPITTKIRDHTFLGEVFIHEKIVWLPLSQTSLLLKAYINNQEVVWSLDGKRYKRSMKVNVIIKHFTRQKIPFYKLPLHHFLYRKFYLNRIYAKRFHRAWILMDRDTQADDNAEHLYRYMRKKYPETNLFFLLRKSSHDWARLQADGFNLLAFGSHAHKAALLHAEHNISSHIDHYVTQYLSKKWYGDLLTSKYTFLQHGITLHNISTWLNAKDIACFITAAKREYDSIVVDHTPYKFTRKEVQLTGFPRHDALLAGADKMEKIILIMPTWRQSLAGEVIGLSNQRTINPQFQESRYYKAWSAILHSKRLKALSWHYQYTIIFFLHANMQPYLHLFTAPAHIQFLSHDKGSIQTIFQRSSLMITDYSSVAFEMAMLRRGIIYYQFDHKEVFSGTHLAKKGYFDYEQDGFGPVCYQEDNLLDEVEKLLENESLPEQKYQDRMKDFFAFHDTDNCKRTCQAIMNL